MLIDFKMGIAEWKAAFDRLLSAFVKIFAYFGIDLFKVEDETTTAEATTL